MKNADYFSPLNQKGDVVMIGDSITNGGDWSKMFPSISIVNRGISGDTAEGILKRMYGIYSVNAKKAFILVGINDLARGQTVKYIFVNYSVIAKNLAERGVKVYIQSTLFCNGKLALINILYYRQLLSNINALNSALEQLAKENGYKYINLNSKLSKNGELNTCYTADGVHLNDLGYSVWKSEIEQYVTSQ